MKTNLASSPMLVRVGPFFIFLVLTSLPGLLGETSRYWLYLAKTLVGAGMLWAVWPYVSEMRWKISVEAVFVGVAVFVLWVGLDNFYPKLGKAQPGWNPHEQFGTGSWLTWLFIAVRLIGSTLVVPPLEEVFYRSFVCRYIIRPDFQSVPIGEFRWGAFLITSIAFVEEGKGSMAVDLGPYYTPGGEILAGYDHPLDLGDKVRRRNQAGEITEY